MSDTGYRFKAEKCRSDRIVNGTVKELTCNVSVLNTNGLAVGSRDVSFARDGSEFIWNWTETSSGNDTPGEQFIAVTQKACAHVDSHFQPDVVADGVAGWSRSGE